MPWLRCRRSQILFGSASWCGRFRKPGGCKKEWYNHSLCRHLGLTIPLPGTSSRVPAEFQRPVLWRQPFAFPSRVARCLLRHRPAECLQGKYEKEENGLERHGSGRISQMTRDASTSERGIRRRGWIVVLSWSSHDTRSSRMTAQDLVGGMFHAFQGEAYQGRGCQREVERN